MKKLEMSQMENVQGGAGNMNAACAIIGFAYGFANPFLGAALGYACSEWGHLLEDDY